MSYILDALKKAEQERGRPRGPALTAVQDLPRRGSLLTAIVCGSILCAAALIGLVLPAVSRIFRPPATPPVSAAQNRAANRPEAERVDEAAAANKPSLPLPAPEPGPHGKAGISRSHAAPHPARFKSDSRAAAASSPQTEIASPDGISQKPPEAARRPSATGQDTTLSQKNAAVPTSPHPAGKVSTQPGQSSYDAGAGESEIAPGTLQTRPLPLQEAMAKMTLTLISCDDSGEECFVYINGRKYVKGDHVDGHYLIESITLQGPMLSYEGDKALLRH